MCLFIKMDLIILAKGGIILSKFQIKGGNKLFGTVRVDGAKNAILPALSATILSNGINILKDVPDLRDVWVMIDILKSVGCKVSKEGSVVTVDSSSLNTHIVPEHLVREMRSSFVVMGAMLARLGKVDICYPGGCEIGLRPIDLHIKGLKQLGVNIIEEYGFLHASSDKITGAEIQLDIPSVGATQNIMFASLFAEGTTIIRNAAKEPEIVYLQKYLNAMGAKIKGAGTNIVRIDGVKKLNPIEFDIMPDRIVGGTYLTACAMSGGSIEVENVEPEHIQSVISKLRECGCILRVEKNKIYIMSSGNIKAIDTIRTQPYPGFPTDMQAQFMALLTKANGTSIITETVFENRFKHVEELTKMGADIRIDGRVAIIKGVKRLTGANVLAKDLRGGAALVIAGLVAEGDTIIEGVKHIDRGYDGLEKKLMYLGADIKRIEE